MAGATSWFRPSTSPIFFSLFSIWFSQSSLPKIRGMFSLDPLENALPIAFCRRKFRSSKRNYQTHRYFNTWVKSNIFEFVYVCVCVCVCVCRRTLFARISSSSLGSCRARCNLQVRDTINFMNVCSVEAIFSSSPSFSYFRGTFSPFLLSVLIG